MMTIGKAVEILDNGTAIDRMVDGADEAWKTIKATLLAQETKSGDVNETVKMLWELIVLLHGVLPYRKWNELSSRIESVINRLTNK
jgi:hypothetical protein